ncbi:MAG: patatin-like phospholipase family protein [Smithellaceae bacterium]
MKNTSPYSAIVFAGGGCRCLWQVGFLSEAEPALGIKPNVIAAASAGAAMACIYYAGRADFALDHFKKATSGNRKNFYLSNLFADRPAFPHYAIYRDLMLAALDKEALMRLRKGPSIRVAISRPPAGLGPRAASLIGILAYLIDRRLYGYVHPKLPARLGFHPEILTAQNCKTAEDLADLVLASSCTPPFTPILRITGKTALDGGLFDNVPSHALSKHDNPALILLTRRYAESAIPKIPGRLYVQPSQPLPISKWDYTNPLKMQETFDSGRKDGERFATQQIETHRRCASL